MYKREREIEGEKRRGEKINTQREKEIEKKENKKMRTKEMDKHIYKLKTENQKNGIQPSRAYGFCSQQTRRAHYTL